MHMSRFFDFILFQVNRLHSDAIMARHRIKGCEESRQIPLMFISAAKEVKQTANSGFFSPRCLRFRSACRGA